MKLKKSRTRKVNLFTCPKCSSLNICGGTNIGFITNKDNATYYNNLSKTTDDKLQKAKFEKYSDHLIIGFRCIDCKWWYKEDKFAWTAEATNADFMNLISDMSKSYKSPQEMTLTLRGIVFQKKQLKFAEKQVEIYANCETETGGNLRFGNNSAVKLMNYAIKDKKFKARVAFQKFIKKNPVDSDSYNVMKTKSAGYITNFRQSPKIISKDIEVIL